MVAAVSSPSSDPTPALSRIADELAAVRQSVDGMGKSLAALTAETADLRARLEQSERARGDLVQQTEHVIELLAQARRELRAQKPAGS